MRGVYLRLTFGLTFALCAALPCQASEPQLSPLPAGVREAVVDEQAATEEIFAAADAALWVPKLHVVRWIPAGQPRAASPTAGSPLARFTSDVEGALPALRSGVLGPWLLKQPFRGDVLPGEPKRLADRPPAAAPESQVFTDGFESLGNWDLGDNRNGAYDFAAATCAAHSGSRSADAIRGGATGATLACGTFYPANTVTQITHKSCEGLSGAPQAWVDWYLSCALSNGADFIAVGYILPSDSSHFCGYSFTGTSGGWIHMVQNLKLWPCIGDITTISCPKILFQFGSGSAAGGGFGVRVDDLTIGTDTPSFLRATASASPASGPAPLAVNLSASLAGAAGTETFFWIFDSGGSTSTQQNPTFTYGAAGDYYPKVYVYGAGVTANSSTKVHVDPPCASPSCTANVPSTGTAGSPVSYSSTVSGCTGAPTFSWNFGDNQTSNVQNPTHAYASAGTYSWTFTGAYGSAMCSRSGSITITGGVGNLPGDCNGDGTVDVAEVQKAINMLLGVQAVGCNVDANGNGTVDVAEVQRVINAFLGGGSGGITVTVNPPTAALITGATQAFTATVTGTSNTSVTWSVQEGSAGGTISSSGSYTAPSTSGVYHVVAASQADASKTGSATVTVGAVSSQKGIVYGTVKDAAGTALGGVTVAVGALSVTTNDQGYFTINDVPASDRAVVAFSKSGYVPTTKIIRVSAGQGSFLEANLATAKPGQPIDASTGGTVTSNGGSATFPPGAFVTAAGSPHTGTANISLTPFDPTDPAQLNAFPGNFEGVRHDGSTIFFVTFGWMDVTATTTTGAPLQLATGKTATISIPVPSAIQSGAPASLPQWYFDTSSGVWREEGTFTYSNGKYTGTIPHLSIWNCDVGAARCTITGRVVDAGGDPVQCASVSMLNLGPRGRFTSGETCTPSDGRFAVPVDASSQVTITASKGGVTSQPLTTDTCVDGGTRDVGDITLGTVPVKITLTWGADPQDLDSHLGVPNASGQGYTHIFFGNKTAEDGKLDTDDVNGFGPEIVSINKLHAGTYRYSVHHYYGTGTIASSPAVVNIIIEGQGIYSFSPPAGAAGVNDVWRVFDLVVDSQKRVTLRPINIYIHGITYSFSTGTYNDPNVFFP